jgi:chemotaxis protein methyltransferase CheR
MTPPAESLDVARFRKLVRARTGMVPTESRAADLTRTVRRAVADLGVADASALNELLSASADASDALDAVLCALNVSETNFFRHAGQIDALEQRVLPELIARRRDERRLRLWSAGCSTGEEPYTLAMLVSRLLPDLHEWDVLILATDLNGRSLERARRGLYRAWSLRGISPATLAPYLTRQGEQFEVTPALRAMVSFAQLNLAEDVYPAPATNTEAMDLVLCRNVLMYFDDEGRRAVIARMGDALTDGGYLLTSHVEAGLDGFDNLAREAPGTAIYRKLDARAASIDAREEEPAAVRLAAAPVPRLDASPRPRRRPAPPPRAAGPDEVERARREALALWRAGSAEAALRGLEAATARRPLEAPLHYLHGLMLLDAGPPDEALAAFRRCTYADPGHALGHLALAGLFARLGFGDRALKALETTRGLVERLEHDTLVFIEDELTLGDVLELIVTQRALLAAPDTVEARRA